MKSVILTSSFLFFFLISVHMLVVLNGLQCNASNLLDNSFFERKFCNIYIYVCMISCEHSIWLCTIILLTIFCNVQEI